jgi:hypothetical protein
MPQSFDHNLWLTYEIAMKFGGVRKLIKNSTNMLEIDFP